MAGAFDKIANMQVSPSFEIRSFFIITALLLVPIVVFLAYAATLNGQAIENRAEKLALVVAPVETTAVELSATEEQIVDDIVESATTTDESNDLSEATEEVVDEMVAEVDAEESPNFATINIDDLLYDRSNGNWQPQKAPTGETVFTAYQTKPSVETMVNEAKKPKVAIVFIETDISADKLKEIQNKLPNKMFSFGFDPYDKDLESKTKLSRNNGFESWLMLPTEPTNYPYNDRGPLSLLTNEQPANWSDKLQKLIVKAPYIIGLLGYSDTVFMDKEDRREDVAQHLNKAGFAYIHGVNNVSVQTDMAQSIPYAEKDIIIDSSANTRDIANALVQLETIAENTGYAIGYAHLYTSTLNSLSQWVNTLPQRDILLVPASYITKGTFANSTSTE